MSFEQEHKVLSDFIRNKNLRQSGQRLLILDIFLKTEKHLTAEELYDLVKRKNSMIGYATIYRSLK